MKLPRKVCLLTGACVLGSLVSTDVLAGNPTWPATNATWIPMVRSNVTVTDPDGDAQGNHDHRDLIGSGNDAVVLAYSDATHLFLRIRLNDDPVQSPGNLKSFGWGCLIDADGVANTYEWVVLVDGTGNGDNIALYKNSSMAALDDPLDDPDTNFTWQSSVTGNATTDHVRVLAANTSLAGTPDYFLDMAVDRSAFSPALPATLRLLCGSSNQGRTLSADLGSSTGATTLSGTFSDPVTCGASGCVLDSDGDGVPNAEEVTLGTNPTSVDSDGDGIYDNVELSATGGSGPFTAIDTDGDNTIDALDTDSDNDGIQDALERDVAAGQMPADFDNDGTPNYRDTDSDNDNIADAVEAGGGPTPTDTDGAGKPDYLSSDSDGDGVSDLTEGGLVTPVPPANQAQPNTPAVDTDSDLNPDYRDLDSDNDCVPDATDAGAARTNPAMPNANSNDNCGAGNTCSAGVCTSPNDLDGDGVPNATETSLGTNPNARDSDGDGIEDNYELSATGGTGPFAGVDTDGDTIIDALDTDSDGDGIADDVERNVAAGSEPQDFDSDGTPNYRDTDSDNDNLADRVEAGSGGGPFPAPVDTDSLGAPDYLSLDSDGDGVSDLVEGGLVVPVPPANQTQTNAPGVNTDTDPLPDYRDLDSDNDCLPDSDPAESGAARTNPSLPSTNPNANCAGASVCIAQTGVCAPSLDTDEDGVPDALETLLGTNPQAADSDGDGIPDNFELSVNGLGGGGGPSPVDTDGDTIIDALDSDSDGDGIPDAVERDAAAGNAGDFDGDLTPNYRDLDSDADGISDQAEAGPDPQSPRNTDGTAKPDYLDTDSDDDTLSDSEEKGSAGTPTDTDGDGLSDYRDLDSDNDCVSDQTEGVPNYKNSALPNANADLNCSGGQTCNTQTGLCGSPSDAGVFDAARDAALEAAADSSVTSDAAQADANGPDVSVAPVAEADGGPPGASLEGGGCACSEVGRRTESGLLLLPMGALLLSRRRKRS